MRTPIILAVAAGLVAVALSARADAIALTAELELAVSNGQVLATITVNNIGDTPARSITPVIRFGTNEVGGATCDELTDMDEWRTTISAGPAPVRHGAYPVALNTRFTDANGYPFSVVTVQTLVVGAPSPESSPVGGWFEDTVVGEEGQLALTITNRSDGIIDAQMALFLPDDFATPHSARNIALRPGAAKRLLFPVMNRTGQPDSTHSVFATLTCVRDGRDAVEVIHGQLHVLPALPWPARYGRLVLALFGMLVAGFLLIQSAPVQRHWLRLTGGSQVFANLKRARWAGVIILATLAVFIGSHLALSQVFRDTMTVGGDTPAHNYMASHLAHSLFRHGQIISWAPGWWCGFPLFQYYFPIPYILMAFTGLLLPFNIAFKLVSISGILLMPFCAWGVGRLMRLTNTTAILLAVVATLFLFVETNTMWGANIYSTLAGMIANSISFPLMLLFLGAAWRDAEDERFRVRTVVLFAAVIGTHFFTALLACLTVAIYPILRWPRIRRVALILAGEIALATALMAWWVVPLILKNQFSVDFGENWGDSLESSMPGYAAYLFPAAAAGFTLAAMRGCRPVLAFAWLGLAGTVLYMYGNRLTPVFVNVRFWPFLFFSFLALTACGVGFILEGVRKRELPVLLAILLIAGGFGRESLWGAMGLFTLALILPRGARWPELAAFAAAVAVMLHIDAAPNEVHNWARWNFAGLEEKPFYTAFDGLLRRIRDKPGRLANDLTAENNVLGSSRIFEAVPHLCGKPVIEGGIVNSALGSFTGYFIQSETSPNPAGYPNLVRPATLNFTNATRHLELCNVTHFIARTSPAKAALRAMPGAWRFIAGDHGWELYELTTHAGNYVTVPALQPRAVQTGRFKEYALEWLYTPAAADQLFILLPPGAVAPPEAGAPLTEAQFRRYMDARRDTQGAILEWLTLGPCPCPDREDNPIEFYAIDERGADPLDGQVEGACRWQTLFSPAPHALENIFPNTTNYVAYNFINIFSPADQDAILWYANDESVKIWLNGTLLAWRGGTGFDAYKELPVRLRKGRNRLLHKIAQTGGGCHFVVRLTDPEGYPFSNINLTTANIEPPPFAIAPSATGVRGNPIQEESVDHDLIRFRTSAVGKPHLIKVSWFPNWRVQGAPAVYQVTPTLMLVYPDREEVELRYCRTGADQLGLAVTLAGAMFLGLMLVRRRPYPGRLARLFSRVTLMKTADALLGPPACWILGYAVFLVRGRGRAVRTAADLRQARQILLIRPGGMGDMIMLLPAIRHLQTALPLARIDILCESRNMGVLRIAGLAAHAIAYDHMPLSLVWRMVRERYDVAIDSEQFHNFSALMALVARAPVRIGFKTNPARNHIYTHLIDYAPDGAETVQFARLLEPFALPGILPDLAGLLGEAPLPSIEARLNAGEDDARGPVNVACGSSTPYKLWPPERFAELIGRLQARYGVRVTLIGNAGDQRAARAVIAHMANSRHRITDLTGRLTLEETAAHIRAGRLFIGSDSGLGHLAIALGTPTVILFGPSDARKWGREDARHAVVRRSPACAPCFIFGYHKPCHTIVCMTGIASGDVGTACEVILAKDER